MVYIDILQESAASTFRILQSTKQHNIPQHLNIYQKRCENLKTHKNRKTV